VKKNCVDEVNRGKNASPVIGHGKEKKNTSASRRKVTAGKVPKLAQSLYSSTLKKTDRWKRKEKGSD